MDQVSFFNELHQDIKVSGLLWVELVFAILAAVAVSFFISNTVMSLFSGSGHLFKSVVRTLFPWRWKNRSGTQGNPKLSAGIGLPAIVHRGDMYLNRVVMKLHYDWSQVGENTPLERIVWLGNSQITGLRTLLDFYCAVAPWYSSSSTPEYIGVPFLHLAFISSSKAVDPVALRAQSEFIDEFAAILPVSSEPRFRHFFGAQTREMFIFFGHGVFVPTYNETPAADLFLERDLPNGETERIDITLGRPGNNNNIRAGLYPGQKALAFSNDERLTPAAFKLKGASGQQDQNMFLLEINRQYRTPRLSYYPVSGSQQDMAEGDDKSQPFVQPAIKHASSAAVIEPMGSSYVSGNSNRIVYDLTEQFSSPDGRSSVRLVCVPDATPERLRTKKSDFVKDEIVQHPFFEIEAILLPHPSEWENDATNCVIYCEVPGQPAGSVICDPQVAVSLYHSGTVEVETTNGEIKVAKEMKMTNVMIHECGLKISQDPLPTWQNVRPRGGDITRPINQNESAALPLSRYIIVRPARGPDNLGYISSLVGFGFGAGQADDTGAAGDHLGQGGADTVTYAPDETVEGNFGTDSYVDLATIVYKRFASKSEVDIRRGKKAGLLTEEYSLAWLDHAVSIEMRDNAVLRRVGLADWWSKTTGNDGDMAANQTLKSVENGMVIVDHYHDNQDVVTDLQDGTLFRLGPLVVRARMPDAGSGRP